MRTNVVIDDELINEAIRLFVISEKLYSNRYHLVFLR